MSDVPRDLGRDLRRDRPAATRGLRIGVVTVLVAIAFLVGLALAIVLVRRQASELDTAVPASLTQSAAPPATLDPGSAALPAPPVREDPVALAARETALAGQIAALEARSDALAAAADGAGGQAARAEALLVTVAARRALDHGAGLGALDEQLRTRLGAAQPGAVATVRQAGRQPVTLEELRQGLDAIGPVLTTGVGRSWVDSLRHGLATLVVLHRAGTPSPLAADHLARARRLLDGAQVEAAVGEVRQLPGAGDAANWLGAAQRYIGARYALDALENAALAGQAQPARIAPAAAPLTP